MKKIRLFFAGADSNSANTQPDPIPVSKWNRLLNRHLAYIETQCRFSVNKLLPAETIITPVQRENEALELFNRVLDKLTKNNFRLLQNFRGESRITTYLSAVIARQAVDMVREKRGRSRARARAKKLGTAGLQIFESLIREKRNVAETVADIQKNINPNLTEAEITGMADLIRGSRIHPVPLVISEPDLNSRHSSPFNSRTAHPDPESRLLAENRQREIRSAVKTLLSDLSGEERLLMRLKFFDEKKMNSREIAALLDIPTRLVYKKISRLKKRAKKILDEHGLSETIFSNVCEDQKSAVVRHNHRRQK